MRVLLGAVEMYNMEHKMKMKHIDKRNIELLVNSTQRYLRGEIQKPEESCEYHSYRDISSSSGFLFCDLHGSVEDSSVTKLPAPPPGPILPPLPPPTIWDRIVEFFKRF